MAVFAKTRERGRAGSTRGISNTRDAGVARVTHRAQHRCRCWAITLSVDPPAFLRRHPTATDTAHPVASPPLVHEPGRLLYGVSAEYGGGEIQ